MKDLKDRDEFHQRMVAKDKEKQKNKMDKKDKRAYEEAAKRLAQVVILFHCFNVC
jgi:pre-mRNA-splicing factor ATP-dependent RNA helicase DHX16